jgi:uncharacterized protein
VKMSKRLMGIGIAAAVVLVFSGFVLLQRGDAQSPEPEQLLNVLLERSVTVTAVGQVRAQPDQAIVRLGVETEAETAGQALSRNNQQMNALLESLRAAGIPSQDVQTQTIRLSPRFEEVEPTEGEPTRGIVGYRAVNVVEVRSRDLQDLGEVIDTAVEAGGNVVEGIRFEVSNRSRLLDQARDAAMAEARRKAEQLANAAGVSIDQVLTIEEADRTPGPAPGPAFAAPQQAVPVEPGEETIEVMVEVTWMLR